MKISIAGAGAGKTTTMADTIVNLQSKKDSHLNIFCITFTNNAVACIERKLKEHYGELPDNIMVSTIHSFLYREFIKPYYYLLYGKQYERISTAELPQKATYKNATIKRLEDRNILHQTVIPERAKWVLVKKSDDRKTIKDKREIIKSVFKKYCGALCVDEAQDMDSDMLEIVEVLHKMSVPIILMGDPKQDLKGHKCLRKIMEQHPSSVEYLSICHRCPQKHLKLSNQIVAEQERQQSEKTTGTISIWFENDKPCSELMQEEKFDLAYISKKQGIYETHGQEKIRDIKMAICEEIEAAMRVNHPAVTELVLRRGSYYLAERLIENYKNFADRAKAMNNTFKNDPIRDKNLYGRIINLLPEEIETTTADNIVLCSIDSIKGQEGENCLFILTTDLAAYLFGEKSDDKTTKNRLYVALTRSLDKLTIFITVQVERKYSRDFILDYFEKTIGKKMKGL